MNSPLITYALEGLRQCWLPAENRWSHIYHLDGRETPNQSLPHSDVFYTINVLVGLSRTATIPDWINIAEIFECNTPLLKTLPVRKYALGTGLWASAAWNLELPDEVMTDIADLLRDEARWREFYAQDLGMLLIGAIACAENHGSHWKPKARKLFDFLTKHYASNSKLFFDSPFGMRQRFSSFATQTYLTLACYRYGDTFGDERATALANNCARTLIRLQGPNGEWPWFFDSFRGVVLDYYEVYSVHQYGMAPAFLEWAERHQVEGAREALVKGFNWVLGQNQLGISMLVPDLRLSIRSQVRKGELKTSSFRAARAIKNAALMREAQFVAPAQLDLRRECRSYELGWILWSFGQRDDLPELTQHPMFGEAGTSLAVSQSVPDRVPA